MAPFYTLSYLFFNLALNILMVLVLKHGSAAILAMSSTILVPLGNFAFSLDCMPGHKPQRPTDIFGLVSLLPRARRSGESRYLVNPPPALPSSSS